MIFTVSLVRQTIVNISWEVRHLVVMPRVLDLYAYRKYGINTATSSDAILRRICITIGLGNGSVAKSTKAFPKSMKTYF